ncbi:MAG: hypothetical protein H6737_32250 [Alphaproteobacteria bacterium]|nr:hypothetical protein [Alphaproteobacteria bacterium]
MEPGPEIDRVEFSPWFGWLFRAQVRALTVHEHGLVMVRGTGTEFVPWSDVGQVMAGERGLRSRSTGEASDVFHYFILVVRGEVIEMPSQIARQAGQRIAMHIAERAQLQWMDLPNGMRSARRLK